MKKISLLLVVLLMSLTEYAQDSIFLYKTVPNSKPSHIQEKQETDAKGLTRISDVTNPCVFVFRPAKEINTGAAVVICPGGGYARLAITHEGYDVAKKFASWGITAFVLKYRLPGDSIMQDKTIGPLQDAQRAIQLVRERAAEWGIDINKVGIMGFSAGGHLASTAGTHFTKAVIDNPANISLRPDFMILGYPVISFNDSICHKGSKINLIGKQPTNEQVAYYSNELQVTAQTPPTFLVHAGDDKTVPVQNSLYFYAALAKQHVLAEMHVYPQGGHGFGMNNTTTKDQWMDRLKVWMQGNGWSK